MALFEQFKETVGLKKEEKQRFFWAVYIGLNEILLAKVLTQNGKLEILKIVSSAINEEKGLPGLTQALKELIESIEFDQKPKEIFFGVPHSWLVDLKLKKPHQEALKKLTQELGLVLSGVTSSLKAVLDFYTRQEGTPVNLIFLKVGPKKLRAVVCQKGEVVKVGEKEIGESLSSTLQEILQEDFTGESLPSRIVIFNKKDFEKIRGEILSYPFEQTGLFLHIPRIESLSQDDLLKAISFSAKESLKKTMRETKTEEKTRFGFVIGQDVAQKEEKAPKLPKKEEVLPQPVYEKKAITLPTFSLTKISARIKRFSWPSFQTILPKIQKLSFKPAFLAGGLGVLIFVGLVSAYWYLPKAKITIFVEPKELKETLEVLVAPEGFEASESAKVLRGKLVSTDVTGELSAQATGTKLTGEKATGRVTLFNKTLSLKSFPQGTEIVGPNDLSFILDGPVSVDPATISTASGSETKTYGKTEAPVSAKSIGSEYNLPGGIDFSLSDFSSTLYSAYSAEGFTGGSSQEVRVVSEKDQEKLEGDLTEELKQKAKEELQKEIREDLKIFPEAITLEVKNRNFDHEIEEKAETVSLSLEATAQTLGFSEESLRELLVKEVAESVPKDFELVPNQIETQEKFKEQFRGALSLEVEFKANLLPKLNLEKIKQKIAGRKHQVAQEYLTGLSHVAGAQIVVWPPLPSPLLPLPRRTNRISIDIKPE